MYDSSGAVTYMVAVMLTYAVAVIGVFALSFIKRKKRSLARADREAQIFMKSIDDIRIMSEKKYRVGAVAALLEQVHAHSKQSESVRRGASFLSHFAIATMSMADIEEGAEGTAGNARKHKGTSLTGDVIVEEEEPICHSEENLTTIPNSSKVFQINEYYQDKLSDRTLHDDKEICTLQDNDVDDADSGKDLISSNSPSSDLYAESTTEVWLTDSDLGTTDTDAYTSDGTEEFFECD